MKLLLLNCNELGGKVQKKDGVWVMGSDEDHKNRVGVGEGGGGGRKLALKG